MINYEDIKSFIPGICLGITRVSISYPFDVVKVNMQKLLFKNTKETFLYLIKNDISRFYKGSSISYISVSLERSIQYYYLEKCNKIYNQYLSSFIISILTSFITIPAQVITTNIAVVNKSTISIKNIISTTNLYKGTFIEYPKNIIASSIYNGTYFYLRNKYGDNIELSPIYAILSSSLMWSIIFPLDTLKTEYQTSNESLKNIILYRNKIGFTTLYRGITPVIIRTITTSSCGMYVYEYTRKLI